MLMTSTGPTYLLATNKPILGGMDDAQYKQAYNSYRTGLDPLGGISEGSCKGGTIGNEYTYLKGDPCQTRYLHHGHFGDGYFEQLPLVQVTLIGI